jgi:predicted nucleic acid-binding protein
MATTLAFVDTNVLLYAVSTNPAEQTKQQVARKILDEGEVAYSVQVAQEFFVNATRKLNPPLSSTDALEFLRAIDFLDVVFLDLALFLDAVRIYDQFQISYWDAAIVAAARRLGVEILYSEDLADGRSFDGVRAVNPFRAGFNLSSQ